MRGIIEKLLCAMAAGRKVHFDKPKPKYEWPDAPPPQEGVWSLQGGPIINGTPYKKVEVSPGKWQYQVDREAQGLAGRYEADKNQLYSDLRTRVLTDEEFQRAKSLGLSLVTRNMVPYNEQEKRRELDDAFLQQAKLRAVAGRGANR